MESALSFKGSILFSEAVMKKIRMLTTASLALVTFLAGGGVMKAVSAEADYESLRRFSQILDMVEQYYVNEVSHKELLDGALKGMLENLDPHSTLMTKKEGDAHRKVHR